MKIIRPFAVVPSALTSNVVEADYPVIDLTKVYVLGDRIMDSHNVYESLTGKTATITVTIAAPAVVSWVGHGFAAGTPVVFSTTGALPTGIVAGTVYYVIATGLVADAFQFSATLGGTAVTTTGTQSGVHTARGSTNLNKPAATNPTSWLLVGATNRWSMFDSSVQSQTTNAVVIDVSIALSSRVDSVALINIDATAVQITLTDPVDGVVYDKTISTLSTSGIVDMYSYFFEPITRVIDLAVVDIPPYASGVLRIQVKSPSGIAACGGCVLGQSLDIGDTEVGAKVGTQDYSVKTRDNFGNFTIVQRAFNKRANFTITLDSKTVDKLQTMFATYRATPIVWLGSLKYGATLVYGFYKSFEIEIGYADGTSICTLEVEGLT